MIARRESSLRRPIEGRSSLQSEILWAALGSVAFAVAFGFPILRHLTRGGVPNFTMNDWDSHMLYHWGPFYTITHFHQFPLWDPYKCGGMPMLGNPESPFLTPFFVLELLLGPVVGLRLSAVAHIAVAFGGAYFLARVLGISKLGAAACAAAFAGSSWFYLRLEIGHTNFLPCAYIPWPLALLHLGSERRKLTPAVLGGLIMALIVGEGGTYALPLAAALLALMATLLAIQRRTVLPLVTLVIVGIFTAAFAAVKLFPALAFTGANARIEPPAEVNHLRFVLLELFYRNQNPRMTMNGLAWGFYEYGAYIGVIFGALAVAGAIGRFRSALPWLMAGAILLAIAVGNFGRYSPWVLIHRLPFYGSMKGPEKWLIPFTLAIAVLAGYGVDTIREVAGRWGPQIAMLIVVLALIDNWLVSTRYLHYIDEGKEMALPVLPVFRQVYAGGPHYIYGARMYAAAKADIGVISCYENVRPTIGGGISGFDQPNYRGEQYLLGPGTVQLARWTPNALTFSVDALQPTKLIVNQNFDRNWRVVRGRGLLGVYEGLLAVIVPAGKQTIELAYCPRSFRLGLSVTTGAFAVLLLLWWWERRRGNRVTNASRDE
ncbi:MAG: hypothetical protein ACREQI_12020 [Candidatus Binataceae bacterium]